MEHYINNITKTKQNNHVIFIHFLSLKYEAVPTWKIDTLLLAIYYTLIYTNTEVLRTKRIMHLRNKEHEI